MDDTTPRRSAPLLPEQVALLALHLYGLYRTHSRPQEMDQSARQALWPSKASISSQPNIGHILIAGSHQNSTHVLFHPLDEGLHLIGV